MEFEPIVILEQLGITDTVIISWGIMLVLVLGSYLLTRNLHKVEVDKAPRGALAAVEMFIEGINYLVDSSMGKGRRNFVPFIGTLALYILLANLMGLIGLRPPTADLNVPMALAFITFVIIQYQGFKGKGILGRVKSWTEPIPLLTPLNLLSELTNPFSMAFRLFGNMIASLVVMGLIYIFLPIPLLIPIVGHLYFDLFAGVIQTFIFIILAMTFISVAKE